MINRKGQEAGQAISTMVVFFIILVLLAIFYWISSAAALFARGADASYLESYFGSVGNPNLLSLPKTDDIFLKRPILVQFEDGDIQLMPIYTFAALYRSDTDQIAKIEDAISKEPTQTGKDVLIKQRVLAYGHSVGPKVFEDSLRNFLLKQSDSNYCLILGQDIGRDLKSRVEANSNEYYDLFLKKSDSSIDKFKISSSSEYFSKLAKYTYSSGGQEVMLEYYYGPCLGGKS